MDTFESINRNLLVQQLKHECRLSTRQIALLRWSQIGDHEITTATGRRAKISHTTYDALRKLPVRSGLVFCSSPLAPSGIPERTKTEHAKEMIEIAIHKFKNRPHLKIRFE